jgi:hypothetical protein
VQLTKESDFSGKIKREAGRLFYGETPGTDGAINANGAISAGVALFKC